MKPNVIKGDREMMPPPPADYLTKTRARSRSDSPEKLRDEPLKRAKGNIHTYGKGKGRELVVQDDDDEIEVLGSSPAKSKKGDGESASSKSPRVDLKLMIGLEEMWTELYAPQTIVCLIWPEQN
jgi:hypothetical protein